MRQVEDVEKVEEYEEMDYLQLVRQPVVYAHLTLQSAGGVHFE
jgi:hypothetical protein